MTYKDHTERTETPYVHESTAIMFTTVPLVQFFERLDDLFAKESSITLEVEAVVNKKRVAKSQLFQYFLKEKLELEDFIENDESNYLAFMNTKAHDVRWSLTTNERLQNSLHLAVISNNLLVLRRLLASPTRYYVNSQDAFGCTPLHYAAQFNLPDIVSELICAGVFTDIVDDYSKSAYDIANELKNTEVLAIPALKASKDDSSLPEIPPTPKVPLPQIPHSHANLQTHK